ncbi:ribonuclease III, partial [Amylibacter sp.]|nr:ribonuclease III [Amylibacter sp.]
MKPAAELTAFSERLGHNFKKPELLIQAMTHSS